MPGGGKTLKSLFQKEQQKQIKEWIENGGTLVATESAVNFFTNKESSITEVELKENPKDSSDARKYLTYTERQDYFGKQRIPGSALQAIIDTSNPLAFGLKNNFIHSNLESMLCLHQIKFKQSAIIIKILITC